MQALRDAVEAYHDGEDDDNLDLLHDIADAASTLVYGERKDSAMSVGLTIFERYPVKFKAVTYDTAFNAFQAQKAPPDERHAFVSLSTQEATDLGRKCTIDVTEWDAGREDLMFSILKKQAVQHSTFKQCILDHADTDILHDCLAHDPFWGKTLPLIWKRLYAHFMSSDSSASPGPAKKQKRSQA